MTLEAIARRSIDRCLGEAGHVAQNLKAPNPSNAVQAAIRKSHADPDPADGCGLFADRNTIAAIEAERKEAHGTFTITARPTRTSKLRSSGPACAAPWRLALTQQNGCA